MPLRAQKVSTRVQHRTLSLHCQALCLPLDALEMHGEVLHMPCPPPHMQEPLWRLQPFRLQVQGIAVQAHGV